MTTDELVVLLAWCGFALWGGSLVSFIKHKDRLAAILNGIVALPFLIMPAIDLIKWRSDPAEYVRGCCTSWITRGWRNGGPINPCVSRVWTGLSRSSPLGNRPVSVQWGWARGPVPSRLFLSYSVLIDAVTQASAKEKTAIGLCLVFSAAVAVFAIRAGWNLPNVIMSLALIRYCTAS